MCIECVHEVHVTDECLRNAFLLIAITSVKRANTMQRSDADGAVRGGGCRMRPGPRLPAPPVPPAAAVARAPGRAGAVLAG